MYRKPRRILLKFGSGILTRPHANALDAKQFERITADVAQLVRGGCECIIVSSGAVAAGDDDTLDRKSTRLNSSHVEMSYAVFCLKKKNGGVELADKTLGVLGFGRIGQQVARRAAG